MSLNAVEIEAFPKNIRGRSPQYSAEYDDLKLMLEAGKPYAIQNVPHQKANAMKQRIRTFALKNGYRVHMKYDTGTSTLYLQSI